ncbi:hypothetical protein, partial [Gilvibacter sp.]|uniref:hypothetical protein n=1 Tax=Gilvibacter sp. TaxID=2729997 RepID=UPI003F49DA52
EVISFEERRELLKTAMRKCFDKFIIPNKMWWQGKNLLRIAQKSNLISLKEAFAFKVYLYMIRSNKHKTKGFGMYRLYSWSRSVSGLKSEVL